MLEEIKLIISKNLPSEVGDLLKKRLQDADDLDAKCKAMAKDCDDLRRSKDELQKQVDGLLNKVKHQTEIETQRLKNEEDARNFKLVLAETKLKMVEEKCATIQNLADTVFRNPKLTYYENRQEDVRDKNNFYSKDTNHTHKNITIEEGK
jgi:seryl-tRNA synthetase